MIVSVGGATTYVVPGSPAGRPPLGRRTQALTECEAFLLRLGRKLRRSEALYWGRRFSSATNKQRLGFEGGTRACVWGVCCDPPALASCGSSGGRGGPGLPPRRNRAFTGW